MDLNKAARDPWVWGQTILVLLILLAAPLLPRYVNLGDADFLLNRIDPAWIRRLGVILIAGGAGLVVWGVRSLGPSLTPGIEPLPTGQLITTGPYAHVRHPIYSGVVLLLTGYVLSWSNWTMAVLVALLTRTYFEAKAKAEERWLIQRFPGYQSYMRYVQRRVL
jgi:protein-S-isoprenylcysteine O-methyltransferase Ste14